MDDLQKAWSRRRRTCVGQYERPIYIRKRFTVIFDLKIGHFDVGECRDVAGFRDCDISSHFVRRNCTRIEAVNIQEKLEAIAGRTSEVDQR